MGKPNFPEKIWDGTSEDRRRRDFKRSPSANDYEQLVAEIQALQIQLSSLLQQLKVTPVYSMQDIINQVITSTDKKYVTPDNVAIRNPLPRVPNTFIWIDENGQGASLTPEQVINWVWSRCDARYKEQFTQQIADKLYMPVGTVLPTMEGILSQTDLRYLPKSTTLFGKTQADALYLPKNTVFPEGLTIAGVLAVTDTKYMPKSTVLFTKAQADTLYAPISLVATVQGMPTYSAGDSRWKLKGEK